MTTHISTKIVDEIYLHNERANLLFDSYFASGMKEFDSCKNINEAERFFLPNMFNKNRCNYIKYGENSIGNILTAKGSSDYAESMLH